MKTMEIVFENCERLKIDGEITFDIKEVHTDGSKSIDNVKIVIPRLSNGVHDFWGYDSETTKFNRISETKDIAQIHIDGMCHLPVWYEVDDYSWSQNNEYQHTYKTKDGDLIIEVSSSHKQRQSDNEKIVELISDYMREYPTIKFGQVIHKIECKLGNSIVYEENSTVIEMLEELLQEAI